MKNMKEKFNELFSGKLEIERASRNVVVTCDKNYDLCEIDDGLTYEDGKALERAKYIANATNNFADMYEMLEDLDKCYNHGEGGSLGIDGQFYYKVSESTFNKIGTLLKRVRRE